MKIFARIVKVKDVEIFEEFEEFAMKIVIVLGPAVLKYTEKLPDPPDIYPEVFPFILLVLSERVANALSVYVSPLSFDVRLTTIS